MTPDRDPHMDDRWVTAMRRPGAEVPADAAAWAEVRRRAEDGAAPPAEPSRTPRLLAVAVVLVLVGVVGGAFLAARDDGGDEKVRAEDPPTTLAPGPDRFFVATTVLEDESHGPELCLGGVDTSLPPQCGGVPLVGWDWDVVDGEQGRNGVTWGDFEVVGTYDGEALTLTQEPEAIDPSDDPPLEGQFDTVEAPIGTPCPEPAGGWPPGDPAVWDLDAFTRFMGEIRNVPGFAGLWFDNQGIVPDDPLRGVHTIALTDEGDEAAVRALWGGPLCIVPAEHSMADLQAVAEALAGDAEELGIDLLGHFVDEVDNVIELQVVWADETVRSEIDERHGEGLVRVQSALRRIEEPTPAEGAPPTTEASSPGFEGEAGSGPAASGPAEARSEAEQRLDSALRSLRRDVGEGVPLPEPLLPATLPEGWVLDGTGRSFTDAYSRISFSFLGPEAEGTSRPEVTLCLNAAKSGAPDPCADIGEGAAQSVLTPAPEGTTALLIGSGEALAAWDDVEWVTDPAEAHWES